MTTKFDRAALAQNQEKAERYHANLEYDKPALAYLANRGIDADLAERFMLGVCDDVYPGWLSIPYLRPSGVLGFKYRDLTPGAKPKYKGHGAPHLYNTAALDLADETGEIAICEGELDALVSSGMADVPAVGIPGATMWTSARHWRELFVGYPKVWVLADPDEAGLALATAILEDLPAARVVRLPADVNDTYLQHGDIRGFFRG